MTWMDFVVCAALRISTKASPESPDPPEGEWSNIEFPVAGRVWDRLGDAV